MGGVPIQGGVPVRRCTCPGGVPIRRYLPGGCTCLGGGGGGGSCPVTPTPSEQND